MRRGSQRLLRPAFTLFELAMVLAVVAIASAIAIPRYAQSIARYRVEGAAARVARDLALARESARSASASRTVIFRVSAASYDISGAAALNNASAAYSVDLTAEPYRAEIRSANFNNAPTVTFNGFGVPSTGGKVMLRSGSHTRTVVVDPSTGTASITREGDGT